MQYAFMAHGRFAVIAMDMERAALVARRPLSAQAQ
jgi:hypothetical protein